VIKPMNWLDIEQKIKGIGFPEIFSKYYEEMRETLEYSANLVVNAKILKDFFEILDSVKDKKVDAISTLTCLLYLIEGPLSFYLNVIIYSLILKEHHDLWDEIRQKFITSYDEISTINLSVKIKFLERHGFDFFKEICSRELRNVIAHQNFRIDLEGNVDIFKKGKIIKKIYLKEIYLRIDNIVKIIQIINKAFLDQLTSEYPM